MITRTIYVACDDCMDQVELDLDDIGGWWNFLLDMGWEFTYRYKDGWEYTRDPRHIDTTMCPACVEYRDDEED